MWNLSDEQFAALQRRISASSRKVNGRYGLNADHNALGTSPVRPQAAAKPKVPRRKGRRPRIRESQVMQAVQGILESHPLVACWWRQNSGGMRIDKRFIKFSFKGCADFLGFLTDGRILTVECKATGKRPTPEQQAFLDNVTQAGGFACWTDDGANLLEKLEKWRKNNAMPGLQR